MSCRIGKCISKVVNSIGRGTRMHDSGKEIISSFIRHDERDSGVIGTIFMHATTIAFGYMEMRYYYNALEHCTLQPSLTNNTNNDSYI
jgi:hypothetical protein